MSRSFCWYLKETSLLNVGMQQKYLLQIQRQSVTSHNLLITNPLNLNSMQKKRFLSLTVQAIYVLITALELIFIPNTLLGMFGFEPTTEIWIKVLGIVLIAFVLVYYGIIKHGNDEVVRFTVWSRFFVGAGFILMALTGVAPMALILFAGIDIATAIWTWFELKK